MRVDLSPKRVEVTVGESVVLSCKASHDPSLDVSFLWQLNNQPLDARRDDGHFEFIGTVRASLCLLKQVFPENAFVFRPLHIM